MTVQEEKAEIKAPTTYQEWLECFEIMKRDTGRNNGVYEAVVSGSFTGTDITESALQKQLLETVNVILDKSAKRFIKALNESIMFNELMQIDLLFRRLKRDIENALFFEKMTFLPSEFRDELARSVKKQMQDFWDNTVKYLYSQSVEFSKSDLEDTLFLVKRIHLFNS